MALDGTSNYVAPNGLTEASESLPIFDVQRVQLQFDIAADFVAAQVANNVLILALSTGRILRIDLDSPEDIDDIDLPKKSSEIGLIQRMFLDPSASHLIITTTLGENYYLHTQSRQPKALSRLKGVSIESVAWNPSLPTASTREILLGATDGSVYETYIEPSTEFYRREEKYVTVVYRVPDGSPVTGISAELVPSNPESRQVMLATSGRLIYFLGRVVAATRHGRDGGGSIYADLFQRETALIHESANSSSSAPSSLMVNSSSIAGSHQTDSQAEKEFAWLNAEGIYHGPLSAGNPFDNAKMLPRSKYPASLSARGVRKMIQDPITAMTLTRWHVLALVEGRVVAASRLNEEIVYDQAVLEPRQSSLGLLADLTQNTYWLFTSKAIYEVVANDEDRDVWKVLLKENKFDEALQYAHGSAQRDAVLKASGDYLAEKGNYLEAAKVWGKSSKGFEEVCLTMVDNKEYDALRKYLLSQLSTYKKASVMQRLMVASWLVELFMSKLNDLDDSIATKAELTEGATEGQVQNQLDEMQAEFQDFVTRHKSDLDKKTVYDIISSHGREQELLFFATTINDHNYVLSYWIQREKWTEALNVLQRQSEPDVFYKYSSVLMTHAATGLVEILMRQTNLDPERLIPAMLNYNKTANVSLSQNQAVRYLNFIIVNHPNPSAAVHNTLISIHASSSSTSESGLLNYLQSQSSSPPRYDADFALRLCIQHKRVQSCVHIYSAMGQYLQAVELALESNDIELAAIVADRPEGNDKLRKKLWLLVAEKKIQQPGTGIKDAIEFLRRCELLHIEDLIPFFPDFVVIDDFKDEICTALEMYSRHIDELRQEMDNSAQTAHQIRSEIAHLDTRYAIVEPGEKCWICSLPLLSRQFFVFPCQHAFHSDCLGKEVLEGAGGKKKYIRDLQAQMSTGDLAPTRRDEIVKELDGLIAEACILCGDHAIKQIDKPFINSSDAVDEWAL
ncbi:Vps18-like protein [Penicillium ucsense]|uniref:Vps18-like protein n=1 Tax=Penicillium ucsense TaxID=2839758 RepID=A0A8J8WN90_9EURO|nr:Vps18-like protein [Penicillium ucsense]KAF7737587.1 Vps18-like protein [Penicillium ucsense]